MENKVIHFHLLQSTCAVQRKNKTIVVCCSESQQKKQNKTTINMCKLQELAVPVGKTNNNQLCHLSWLQAEKHQLPVH